MLYLCFSIGYEIFFALNCDLAHTDPGHLPFSVCRSVYLVRSGSRPTKCSSHADMLRKTFAWSPLICIFDFTMLNTIFSYQHILGTKNIHGRVCVCVYVCKWALRVGTKWNAFLRRNVLHTLAAACTSENLIDYYWCCCGCGGFFFSFVRISVHFKINSTSYEKPYRHQYASKYRKNILASFASKYNGNSMRSPNTHNRI